MPACILNPGKAVLDLKAYAALLFEAAEPSKFQGYKTTLWPLSPPNIAIMSCFIRLLASEQWLNIGVDDGICRE